MTDLTFLRLQHAIASVLNVPAESITNGASCHTVPGWDSLSILKLVMAIESEFGIPISVDEAVEFTSVATIRGIVLRKLTTQCT